MFETLRSPILLKICATRPEAVEVLEKILNQYDRGQRVNKIKVIVKERLREKSNEERSDLENDRKHVRITLVYDKVEEGYRIRRGMKNSKQPGICISQISVILLQETGNLPENLIAAYLDAHM